MKDNSRPIGVFDSGIGGISVLKEIVSLMRRTSNNVNQIARRLNENGRVMEEYAMNENMGASAFQEAFMRVGGTVALLNRHKTSRDEQTSATHCGLMVLRNGRMEEVYVRGMDWSDLDFSRPKAAAFSPESRKVFIFQLGGQDYIAETGGLTPVLSQWAIVELPE